MTHVVHVPDVQHDEVFVLGAGFSKAVYRQMPLTNELGDLVLERMQDVDVVGGRPRFADGGLTFESWLSWLGEEQPFDDTEATHRRRATFSRLQREIADAVDEAEQRALEEPAAHWLYALIQIFQLTGATVITFNYDRVVEANLPTWLTDDAGEYIRPNDIVVPLYTERGVLFGGGAPSPRDISSFDYLKLHGSIDWWVFPDDATGSSLEHGPRASELTRAGRNMRSTRERFIVPPTAQKSGYYRSQLTHFLWQQAAAALRSAARVAVLGYSLPLTDNATASMLASTLAQTTAPIDIVNPNADDVAANFGAVGCEPDRMSTWADPTCIADYVADRTEELAHAFAHQMLPLVRDTDFLAFAWNSNQRAQVEYARLDRDGRDLVLGTSAVNGDGLVRPDAVLVDGAERTARAMIGARLPTGYRDVERVVLECRERQWLAVGTVTRAVVNGGDDDDWVTFYPLGRPAETSL